jgi:hypothetical protein
MQDVRGEIEGTVDRSMLLDAEEVVRLVERVDEVQSDGSRIRGALRRRGQKVKVLLDCSRGARLDFSLDVDGDRESGHESEVEKGKGEDTGDHRAWKCS